MVVEADGDVPGDLHVLALVLADGDLLGVVEEDVRGLQRRVGQQAGRDEAALLGRLLLVLHHALQLADRDRALHDPAQLGVLGHVALDEDGGDVGVEADRVQRRRQLERLLADDPGLLGHGQGVEVDDPVEGVARVLPDDPVPQRAEVVAEVDLAGGLDAGQDPGHGRPG